VKKRNKLALLREGRPTRERTSHDSFNPVTSTSQGPCAANLATTVASLAPSHPSGSLKSNNGLTFLLEWNSSVSNVANTGRTVGTAKVLVISAGEGTAEGARLREGEEGEETVGMERIVTSTLRVPGRPREVR
jgi:hypothetical protein